MRQLIRRKVWKFEQSLVAHERSGFLLSVALFSLSCGDCGGSGGSSKRPRGGPLRSLRPHSTATSFELVVFEGQRTGRASQPLAYSRAIRASAAAAMAAPRPPKLGVCPANGARLQWQRQWRPERQCGPQFIRSERTREKRLAARQVVGLARLWAKSAGLEAAADH